MMSGGGSGSAGAVVGGGGGVGEKNIEEELSLPILLAERLMKAVREAESFKLECAEVGKQVHDLSAKLRSAVRFATAKIPPPYDRPIRRIFAEAAKNLERALALVRRCKRSGILRRVVTITTGSTDFRKVIALLEASVGDLNWLLSVYDASTTGIGIGISLPPIASTDPILSWVWSYIATVQKGGNALASDRIEAANSLANLALDNERNKKIILEEGGVPPLLSLLRDASSVDAQIAAAAALINLASNSEHVTLIVKARAVPIIVSVLSDSPMRLQTCVAGLVSRMAFHDPLAQEEFALENAIRPLVSLLSFEVPLEDPKPAAMKHTSIHSLVQGMSSSGGTSLNSDSAGSGINRGSFSSMPRDHHHHRKERENESPAVKLQLKIACAEALWMLSKGCLSNSRKITDTKGLLCLSKIVEREKGELQYKCLMTLMEIAAVAECNEDLRRSAFKTNSPAAKSVIDQLLAIQQGTTPGLHIAAIKSIGSLARIFPARDTRVLKPLVSQLEHWNPEVAAEAAIALGKFVNPDNHLHVEHSKTVIEFGAVPSLLTLIRSGEKTQLPALRLLCWLAMNVPDSNALERVLGTLEAVARTAVAQHPSIRELLPDAIYRLELYRVGAHVHRPSYMP